MFVLDSVYSRASTTLGLTTGDFDGNHIPDLAIIDHISTEIWLNSGEAVFSLIGSSPHGT